MPSNALSPQNVCGLSPVSPGGTCYFAALGLLMWNPEPVMAASSRTLLWIQIFGSCLWPTELKRALRVGPRNLHVAELYNLYRYTLHHEQLSS